MDRSSRPLAPVATAAGEPATDDKVRFLSGPGAYSHAPDSVQVEETHMSWVFLAGQRVYKLKKPVRYPFLDFSTLEAREFYVREEVRLNQRLAPDIYLGVTALSVGADGRLKLGAGARTVDRLVTMRRLPEERMLDRLIAAGDATPEMVGRLAGVLGDFFASARPESLDAERYAAHYGEEHARTVAVLADPAFALDGTRLDAALAGFERSYAEARPLIAGRVAAGRIVEGHGDLRPEHVCMADGVAIIDCLEFNRDLRLLDPFEEIAYLGLECAQLGAGWVLAILLERCAERLGEAPPAALVRFYWMYRALLRARLSLAHLSEPNPRKPEKWRPLAWRYIGFAERADLIPSVRRTR